MSCGSQGQKIWGGAILVIVVSFLYSILVSFFIIAFSFMVIWVVNKSAILSPLFLGRPSK